MAKRTFTVTFDWDDQHVLREALRAYDSYARDVIEVAIKAVEKQAILDRLDVAIAEKDDWTAETCAAALCGSKIALFECHKMGVFKEEL